MSPPAIQSLRRMTGFMRLTAALVLIAFTLLVLLPAEKAARQAPERPASVAMAAAGPGPNFLEALRDTARRGKDQAGRGERHAAEDQRLRQAEAELDAAEREAEAGFAEVARHLGAHGLPAEIKQRHQQALAEYRARAGELRTKLRAFREAQGRGDEAGSQRALNDLAGFLDQTQKSAPHQPFDPDNLPFRTPDEQVRPPLERKEELDRIVRPRQPKQVATAELTPGMLAPAEPGAVPMPEDLAETEDVQLTPALRAQAEALHRNPVEIYNWVGNSIEFLPTYGSIQGADLTLQTRRGNAFDTASLLIALLRAADIPARYVYGTIQLPAEQVMNWVGGVNTPEAAQSLLAQGGIPSIGLAQAGRIVAFKLEHVWVEAFVDYVPSRGAVNRTGDTWVPLDACFKQYRYTEGMDLSALSFSDTQNTLPGLFANYQHDDAEGWFAGLDTAAFQTLLADAESQLHGFYRQAERKEQVPRREKVIVPMELPILAGILPYSVTTQGGTTAVLPDSLRLQFRVALYASEGDQATDQPFLSYQASLPRLAGKKLTLDYLPASAPDRQVLASYLPATPAGSPVDPALLPKSLPSYLIQLQPRLRLDDQEVASSGQFALGTELHGTYAISRLNGGWFRSANTLAAGEIHLFGMDLQGIGSAQLLKSPERTATSVLNQAAMAYFAELDASLDAINDLGLGYAYRHPSFGTFSTVVTTTYLYGIPVAAAFSGVRLDLDLTAHTLAAADPNRRVDLNRSIGLKLSALEHEIPELYLAGAQADTQAVSAVKALALAIAAGQRVYTITAQNLDTALSRLQQSPAVSDAVRNAANAGRTVLIPQNPVTVGGWRGAGYIVEDPGTGSGGYLLSGGANGGEMFAGQSDVALALGWAGIPIANITIPPARADDDPCERQRVRVPLADKLAYAALAAGLAALIVSQPETAPLAGNRLGMLIGYFVSANRAGQPTYDTPVLIVGATVNSGGEITEVRYHIARALAGNSPKILTYMGPNNAHSRRWLDKQSVTECNRIARDAYSSTHGMSIPDCDEYPFGSTYEGGQYNYLPPNSWVSLELVRAIQNRVHGGTLPWFYERCVPMNGDFEVKTDDGVMRGEDSQGVPCYP